MRNWFWREPDFIIKWAIHSKLYDTAQIHQKIALGLINIVAMFQREWWSYEDNQIYRQSRQSCETFQYIFKLKTPQISFFLQFWHIVTFVTLVALQWKFGILNCRQCWNYFYMAQLYNHCSLNTIVFPILSWVQGRIFMFISVSNPAAIFRSGLRHTDCAAYTGCHQWFGWQSRVSHI